MSGRRAKALRRELIALIGRAPRKATWGGGSYFGTGREQRTKDEFRTYKRAWYQTRNVGKR